MSINNYSSDEDLDTILSKLEKKKGDDFRKHSIKLISELVGFKKTFDTRKYARMEWSDIVEEFYSDDDLMRCFKMIYDVVSQKQICDNIKCPIFPPLTDIATELRDLPVHSLEEAAKYYKGVDGVQYRKFEKKLKLLDIKLTKIFNQVYQIYTVANTDEGRKQKAHERTLEKARVIGQAGLMWKGKIGTDIDKNIEADEEEVLLGSDMKLKKKEIEWERKESDEKRNKKRR